MAVDDEATARLKSAYGRYQSAAAYYQLGLKEGFPREVLQPAQAMAELAKAQWEELRPLPVRAASAANKLASAEERVQKQAGVLKHLQGQIGLAEAEMIRQQAQ